MAGQANTFPPLPIGAPTSDGYYNLTVNDEVATWTVATGGGGGGPPTGPAGGNLSGTYPNPSVAAVNGTTVPATPNANQVLQATSGSASTWDFIYNANVASSAAVAISKLATGTDGQVIVSNTSSTWTTLTGDVSLSRTGATSTIALQGTPLSSTAPSTNQVLEYNGVHWTPTTIPGAAITTASGLANSLPAASGSGNVYLCTDLPVFYFDNPSTSAWQQFATEYLPAGSAASVANYTSYGSATMSLAQVGKSIRALSVWYNAANAAFALTQANIGSPGYPANLNGTTLWMVSLIYSWTPANDGTTPGVGVVVANGITTNTSILWENFYAYNGTTNYSGINEWTMGNTGQTGQVASAGGYLGYTNGTGRGHLRTLNDGYVMHFQGSSDGFNWSDVYSEPTANQSYYGFALETNNGTTGYSAANIYSQVLSIPTSYNITNASTASPCVFTIGAHSIIPGDLVGIHAVAGSGSLPNTSTSAGGGAFACAVLVTAVSGTTITTTLNYTGTYSGGGFVVLLSR